MSGFLLYWGRKQTVWKGARGMKIDKSAIEEVLYAARRLDERGLVNSYEGNISLFREGLVYVTPTRQSKATLKPI